MYLSWIIPVYNEEKRIAKSLREVDVYLRSKNFDYEILVVNNASQDRTREIVEGLRSEIVGLRLINTQGSGKGWAVREGMLKARGEVRVFSDADNSVSPEQADKFFPFVCQGMAGGRECFDIVIGSIEISGAEVEEKAQWYRRILGKLSKYIIRAVVGLWEIKDTQRGFKFFSRRAAERIFPKITIFKWGFDIEVLVLAKLYGFRVKELPVVWVNPPDSKVSLKAYLSTFAELLKIRLNLLRGKYVGN